MNPRLSPILLTGLLALTLASFTADAQDRLKSMPGYARFQTMSKAIPDSVKLGALTVTWKDGGKAFEYQKDGKRWRYDIAARQATELVTGTNASAAKQPEKKPERPTPRERPERGRQYTNAVSPDGKWRAFYRDRNLWLSATNSTNAIALTTEGSEQSRVKLATANWVYGEELYQTTAMWWSTNSRKLAFYRFDESAIRDYYLTLDETKVPNRLDVEPYMKVGTTNPLVDILVYDLESKKTVKLDVRGGQPFDNAVVGHYVYGVSWTADSKELLFHRTNRRQNIMEWCAANPDTGQCRVIVREEWLPSWTENLPPFRFLKDGRRFIWTSERTGWRNLYLYDLSGALLATLTRHEFEVENIVRVDEEAGVVFYMARDGDNPMKLQLHRVGLDGQGDRRLTDPAFHHSVDLAPDGRHFIDVAQTHDTPPVTRLLDAEGRVLGELARSDTTKFKKLGLKPVELLQFKAADGTTDLYGMLHYPSGFVPYRKYPLLVSVYAGPGTVGARETFTLPNTLTELGFLVASFDSRSASGRGKRFLDAIYQKLGRVEVDDQAAGVKSLWNRRSVDRRRVGMYGTSYGGTVSATTLLRYPDVFQAACANSAVTDYRNYDTIYAERYMWIPQENKAGFEAACVMNYATNLQGRLLIFYGTADNNVHPANSLQLIHALQKAGKSFDVQVGPDLGHTSVNRDRMMEFFIDNLVLRKPPKYRQPSAGMKRPG
ncbi:MAG: DPP IV N-terminal domain-containing protein [Verrucomicrobia bacterium]|nr:DPP IV N-terminal domain-containing protein [Verrucomicrobiota bacterium]